MLPEELFAALARVARLTPGEDPGKMLAVALREATALTGVEIAFLRLTDGPSDRLEIRMPEGVAWPSARRLCQWHADVVREMRPIELQVLGRPHRSAGRKGVVLPIFTARGTVGLLGAFSVSPVGISPEQCASLTLLMQSALTRVEALRLRQDTEVITTTEVRDHIARELHDGPLQMLSCSMLRLRLARAGADKQSCKTLQGLENELKQVIRHTRLLIRDLRITHPGAKLRDRIRGALVRLGQPKNLSWSLRWRVPEGILPARAADEVFRVINEALANVYRHSAAKHVEILGCICGDRLQATVCDDGIGFDVAQPLRRDARKLSFGLLNMQERMAALGGTVALQSQSGRGTCVLISLPIRPKER